MLLGVDYYPEQWDSAIMEADMDRILELGCNVIRIGEFAWHHMEPEEGKFDFSYFDGVIDMAKKKGLQIIFGTPHRHTSRLADSQAPGYPLPVPRRILPGLRRPPYLLLQQPALLGALHQDRHRAGQPLQG